MGREWVGGRDFSSASQFPAANSPISLAPGFTDCVKTPSARRSRRCEEAEETHLTRGDVRRSTLAATTAVVWSSAFRRQGVRTRTTRQLVRRAVFHAPPAKAGTPYQRLHRCGARVSRPVAAASSSRIFIQSVNPGANAKCKKLRYTRGLQAPENVPAQVGSLASPLSLPSPRLIFLPPYFSAGIFSGGVAQGFGRPLGERISWTLFETTMYTVLLVKGAATVAEGAGGLGL